jgi:hypothetical protein
MLLGGVVMKTMVALGLTVLLAGMVMPAALFARSIVVGGFDVSRGGQESILSQGPLQSAITAAFRGTTFSGSPSLTPSYLSSVNAVILGVAYDGDDSITGLSPSEQTALVNFVKAGGTVLLYTESDFSDIFTAANTSFLAPFGLASTGYLVGPEPTTVVALSNPVINGPFGVATGFTNVFTGWFSSLGSAQELITFDTNGQPTVAVLMPGALGPGSGAVVFFSDSNFLLGSFLGDPNDTTLVLNSLALSGCQVTITYMSGPPKSSDGHNTTMMATFMPTSGTLIDAAIACGFQGFEWQQTITNLPCPSPFDANLSQGNKCPDGFLMAPPNFNDPPPGGYTFPPYYLNDPKNKSFPFYYPVDIALSEENNPSASYFCIAGKDCSLGLCTGQDCTLLVSLDGTTLSFHDAPSDPCLPGADPIDNLKYCSGKTAQQKPFMAFTTSLVGIDQGDTAVPLQGGQFTWTDTYNKTSGGIPTTLNDRSVDPGGTGGITITSINGVPQTPPTVSCTASPNVLWPPNGKPVEVTTSGTVSPGTQPIPAYAVIDEYGQVQPSGSFTVGADGSYSFGVTLIASRDGNDKDGRTYTINVIATDQIGNVGSCSAVVTVPHDQGK